MIVKLLWLGMVFVLYGCHLQPQSSTTLGETDPGPYGAWSLLNPEDVDKDIICGGLMIFKEPREESGELIYEADSFVTIFFEENRGHGCTDFVGIGGILYKEKERSWCLKYDDGTWENITLTSDNTLFVELGTKTLQYKRTTEDMLQKYMMGSCSRSLEKNTRKKE
ncbi:hypothetical protein CI610_02342 [invertebrate metagenome]|uniref:Uncharacterized protein n=1 Tax=invertebrate metagenome TaxID=1711999 RepID=A0A2H9T658_9ZZZZ